MMLLGGDVSVQYDAFHSQNRNAKTGIGNFCSMSFGFAILLSILDKDKDKVRLAKPPSAPRDHLPYQASVAV